MFRLRGREKLAAVDADRAARGAARVWGWGSWGARFTDSAASRPGRVVALVVAFGLAFGIVFGAGVGAFYIACCAFVVALGGACARSHDRVLALRLSGGTGTGHGVIGERLDFGVRERGSNGLGADDVGCHCVDGAGLDTAQLAAVNDA